MSYLWIRFVFGSEYGGSFVIKSIWYILLNALRIYMYAVRYEIYSDCRFNLLMFYQGNCTLLRIIYGWVLFYCYLYVKCDFSYNILLWKLYVNSNFICMRCCLINAWGIKNYIISMFCYYTWYYFLIKCKYKSLNPILALRKREWNILFLKHQYNTNYIRCYL